MPTKPTCACSARSATQTGVIYAYISADQFWRGNPGMGIAYFGYALSNIGLYLLAR